MGLYVFKNPIGLVYKLIMPYSWQKEQRLLKRTEFQACYNQGEKNFTKLFLVFVKKTPVARTHARIGLAVSKKNGNAVQRNRIKRLLREFFRLHFARILPYEFVVVPKKYVDAKNLQFEHVEKDLLAFFDRYKTARQHNCHAEFAEFNEKK